MRRLSDLVQEEPLHLRRVERDTVEGEAVDACPTLVDGDGSQVGHGLGGEHHDLGVRLGRLAGRAGVEEAQPGAVVAEQLVDQLEGDVVTSLGGCQVLPCRCEGLLPLLVVCGVLSGGVAVDPVPWTR